MPYTLPKEVLSLPKPVTLGQLKNVEEPLEEYEFNRGRVDTALRQGAVMVVINQSHVKKAEDLITTTWEVYQAGMIPEPVMRFKGTYDKGLFREAMQELTKRRQQVDNYIKQKGRGRPFIISTGSVTGHEDHETAERLGFDIWVGPNSMITAGEGEAAGILKAIQEKGYAVGPGISTPDGMGYMVDNIWKFAPDIIKLFPAGVFGASQTKALLGPFAKDKYIWKPVELIEDGVKKIEYRRQPFMPTGGQDHITGPECAVVIWAAGYHPITGGSDPLAPVAKQKEQGNRDFIIETLNKWSLRFWYNMEEKGLEKILLRENWRKAA